MPEYALGLVETRGLVGSIEAADVMLKTATVTILAVEYVREGLVTVEVVGEVAAVQAAVSAAASAVPRVGELVATHVIPRPADDLASLLEHQGRPRRPVSRTAKTPLSRMEQPSGTMGESIPSDFDAQGLEGMTVHQLRSLARGVKGLGIAGRQISKANKRQLIDELSKLRRSH
jgi:microcompartment protein CcmL/EutN